MFIESYWLSPWTIGIEWAFRLLHSFDGGGSCWVEIDFRSCWPGQREREREKWQNPMIWVESEDSVSEKVKMEVVSEAGKGWKSNIEEERKEKKKSEQEAISIFGNRRESVY